MKARWIALCVSMVAAGAIIPAGPAAAAELDSQATVSNTDFASFGVGGMRGTGTGSITVSGIAGTVTQALLYWNGPENDIEGEAQNAAVTFDGTPVLGTAIGTSSDNCWGFDDSKSYRADVTEQVAGNGSYSLSDFRKTSESGVDADINGVSLIVFFNDGDFTNNKDVTIVDGNDSNVGGNGFDSDGWDATITGIPYQSGAAHLQLHVGDGQTFTDGAVTLNASTLVAAGHNFEGDSVPPGAANGLWDIKNYTITSFMSSPSTTLHLTSGAYPSATVDDCLSLVAAVVDVPTPRSADTATGFCSGATDCTVSTDTGAGATKTDPVVSTLKIPAGADPQSITMDEVPVSTFPNLCGNKACSGQVLVFTSSPGPTFSGVTDPTHPVVLDMIFDKSVKQGSQIWVDKGLGPKLVPQCTTAGIASPHPCVSQKNILLPTGDRLFRILFLEGDPTIGKH